MCFGDGYVPLGSYVIHPLSRLMDTLNLQNYLDSVFQVCTENFVEPATYVHTVHMRNNNQILYGDQTRFEEKKL